MKKILLIITFMFLLTACNSRGDISCSKENKEENTTNIFYAYLKDNKVNRIDAEIIFNKIEDAKNECESYKRLSLKEDNVICTGNSVLIENASYSYAIGGLDLSKEEFINNYEKNGYKCK